MTQKKKPRDYTYVSFSKHDNAFYNKHFVDNLDFAASADSESESWSIYKNVLKVKKDLKIPSREINKRMFLEIYNEHKEDMIQGMATARRFADINQYPKSYEFKGSNDKYKGDYKRAFNDAVKYYTGRYSKMTLKQLEDDAYHDFMNAISDNKTLRDMYFEKLRTNGYNAVIDDNDVIGLGARGYEKGVSPISPLIVIDAAKNLKTDSSSLIKTGRNYKPNPVYYYDRGD